MKINDFVKTENGNVGKVVSVSENNVFVYLPELEITRSYTINSLKIIMSSPIKNSAQYFLHQADVIMRERSKQHDSKDGERSMCKTIKAFNSITGYHLTDQDGWLFMLLLKQVRQWQKEGYHQDSAEDGVAYAALLAESLAKNKVN